MPIRATRIKANKISTIMRITGLSLSPPPQSPILLQLIPPPPHKAQALVGGKQLQQSQSQLQFVGPGAGVGTKKQQMNPGQYVSSQHVLSLLERCIKYSV